MQQWCFHIKSQFPCVHFPIQLLPKVLFELICKIGARFACIVLQERPRTLKVLVVALICAWTVPKEVLESTLVFVEVVLREATV